MGKNAEIKDQVTNFFFSSASRQRTHHENQDGEGGELVFRSPLISFMFVPQTVVFSYVGIYMVLSWL